jgi:hypothetical protein
MERNRTSDHPPLSPNARQHASSRRTASQLVAFQVERGAQMPRRL